MKKLILFSILIKCSLFYSQIQKIEVPTCDIVGKISSGAYLIKNEKCGDNYRFTYRDSRYSHLTVLKSFQFKDTDDAYNYLYKTIENGFDDLPEEIIYLNLPNDIIGIKFSKMLGIPYFSFIQAEGKNSGIIGNSATITKKQFLKLFGKK